MSETGKALKQTRRLLDAQALIFDKRAGSFDRLAWVSDREFLGNILARISHFITDYRKLGRRVTSYIDIGTGTGEVLKYFRQHFGREQKLLIDAEATGLDVSKEMIAIASSKLGDDQQVKLVRGSVYDRLFEEHSFDFAICRNAFHHFGDPSFAVDEMRRLVRKGGMIFIVEGVAPDNYTLRKWSSVLLARDTGRNPAVLLSKENVENAFEDHFGAQKVRVFDLPAVPMLLSEWLNNAVITQDSRVEIISRIRRLFKDETFRHRFGIQRIRESSAAHRIRDYRLKKRSVMVEFKA
jgi:ubiquinone/menaquinone biosynthesis C-methylase UbiE